MFVGEFCFVSSAFPINSEQRRGSFHPCIIQDICNFIWACSLSGFFFSWSAGFIGFGAAAFMRHHEENARQGRGPHLMTGSRAEIDMSQREQPSKTFFMALLWC